MISNINTTFRVALLKVLTLLGFLWIATWNGQNEYDTKQISGTKEKKR